MDVSTSLGFIGILASIIFGIWGIYYTIKQRYPGQITFIKEQTIALFDTIVKNLPELSVLYKGAAVSPNIVLIRGALVNSGKKDISPTMVEKPITISLPEKYKWITAKVISTSENVQSDITLRDERTLEVNNSLFRCKEYICFQALAEVPSDEKNHQKDDMPIKEELGDSLSFSHRIEDTREIEKIELKEEGNITKRLKRYILYSIVGAIVFIVFLIVILIRGVPGQFVYSIKTDKNEIIKATVKPLQDNTVRVTGIDNPYNIIMPVNEFFANCKETPQIKTDKWFAVAFIIMFGYVLIPLIMLIYRYREYKINKRLRRMLSFE